MKKNVSTLSKGSVDAARRDGRVVGQFVYGTKAEASAARTSGPKKTKAAPKRQPKKAGAPKGTKRISQVLTFGGPIEVEDGGTLHDYLLVRLNGPQAEPELLALAQRHPVVNGVRLEVSFDSSTETEGRYVYASANVATPGDKTTRQLATLPSHKECRDVTTSSRWFTVPGVACRQPIGPAGVPDVKPADLKVCMFAMDIHGCPVDFEFSRRFHVTVVVDDVDATEASVSQV